MDAARVAVVAFLALYAFTGGGGTASPTTSNPDHAAAALCASLAPSPVVNSAPTSVGAVRLQNYAGGTRPGAAAFTGVPGGQFAAWCWTGVSPTWTSYVVTAGQAAFRFAQVTTTADVTAPGPPGIP